MNSIHANGLTISNLLQKLSDTPNPMGNTELIVLVSEYLKEHKQDCTRYDAIRWITSMQQNNSFMIETESEKFIQENSMLELKSMKKIENLGLIRYCENFGISVDLTKKYLLELKVHQSDTSKDFYTVGFKNESSGFEIRSPFIKGCIGQKDITFIRGYNEKSETLHIFKSFWDYLALLSHLSTRSISVDCIILNSFACMRQAFPYIRNHIYKTTYSWLDNYPLGYRATSLLDAFLNTQTDVKHISMNRFYSPYTDVSKWYQAQIKQ